MLEEAHSWCSGKQQRWEKTRSRGQLHYVMKVLGVTLGICLLIAAVYGMTHWNEDREFPWSKVLGILIFGGLSGLITAIAKWCTNEDSFKRLKENQTQSSG